MGIPDTHDAATVRLAIIVKSCMVCCGKIVTVVHGGVDVCMYEWMDLRGSSLCFGHLCTYIQNIFQSKFRVRQVRLETRSNYNKCYMFVGCVGHRGMKRSDKRQWQGSCDGRSSYIHT